MSSITSSTLFELVETPASGTRRADLPGSLRAIERQCTGTDLPLGEWFGLLYDHSDKICLCCRMGDDELYLTWCEAEDRLYELQRTDSDGVYPPQHASVVRTAAAIENADAVNLAHLMETPIAWSALSR